MHWCAVTLNFKATSSSCDDEGDDEEIGSFWPHCDHARRVTGERGAITPSNSITNNAPCCRTPSTRQPCHGLLPLLVEQPGEPERPLRVESQLLDTTMRDSPTRCETQQLKPHHANAGESMRHARLKTQSSLGAVFTVKFAPSTF